MSTAAELRAAAEYFASHEHCECDREVGIYNCVGCDVQRMASHILATVHADDDEPVTVGWYRENGFADRHCDASIELQQTLIVDLWGLDMTVCNARPHIKTRGDVRRLCAAIGIEMSK